MHGRFMTCLFLLVPIQDVIGSLHNFPCKRTEELTDYHLQCSNNSRIHINRHVIEEGFYKLKFPALGCTTKDALYCGGEMPQNNIINLQNGVFVNAVKQCNGKTECILSKEYFVEAEKSVRDSCDTSTHRDLQKAKFRQSMDYECIGGFQMMDMCTRRSENRSQNTYLEATSTGPQRKCSCHVTGSASKVEVLQTISSKVQIFSNHSFVLDHQNSRLGIYGMEIPVNANSLTVTLLGVSNESSALIKIVGNVLVECNKEYETTAVSTSPLHNTMNMNSPSQLKGTTNDHVTTAHHTSERTTKDEHNNGLIMKHGSSDLNMKSWTRSLTLALTAFILVVILLLLISVIQRRKDRDLLLAILLKLDENVPSTDNDHHSATPETNHSQISDNDRNYQEISSHFLSHANATQLLNPNYEMEVKSQSGLASQDVFVSMDKKSDQSLLHAEETNGVYELQQRF